MERSLNLSLKKKYNRVEFESEFKKYNGAEFESEFKKNIMERSLNLHFAAFIDFAAFI
jgi:hypothetical protein